MPRLISKMPYERLLKLTAPKEYPPTPCLPPLSLPPLSFISVRLSPFTPSLYQASLLQQLLALETV